MIKRGINKTLAEVGKIKTGIKGAMTTSKNGNNFQPPKKLNHFIIVGTTRDKTGNYIIDDVLCKKLSNGNPEGLTEIKIRLPFDSLDKNFFTQFQAYNGKKCVCRGDGENATDENGNKKICDPEKCPMLASGKCKVSGILSTFIPESGIFGGVYKLRTHSWNAVSSIMGSLEYISENTGGIMQGIPLKLVLLKKTTEEHGEVMYPTVVLDIQEVSGLRTLAIAEKKSRLELGFDMKKVEQEAEDSGFFKDDEPEEEVAEEFYPESIQQKGTGSSDLTAKLAEKAAEEQETPPPTAPAPVIAPEKKTTAGAPTTGQKPIETTTPASTGKPPVENSGQFDIF